MKPKPIPRLTRLPIWWRPAAEYHARNLRPAGKARAVRRAIQRADHDHYIRSEVVVQASDVAEALRWQNQMAGRIANGNGAAVSTL